MPAPATAAAQQPAQQEDLGSKAMSIARTVGMFLAVQMAMKYGMEYMGYGPKNVAAPANMPAADGGVGAVPGAEGAAATPASAVGANGGPTFPAYPAWEVGTPMSMYLYINTEPDITTVDVANPDVKWDGLTLGDWKDIREEDLILDVPEVVRSHNASWYMDVLLIKDAADPMGFAHHRKELTHWMPKRRIRAEKSLLGKDEHAEDIEEKEDEVEAALSAAAQPIVSYWSRNLTLTVVSDPTTIDFATLQPPVRPFYRAGPKNDQDQSTYYPVIFPNMFWILKENLIPINETTTQLPLRVSYHAISNMKFQFYSSLTTSFEAAAAQQGSGAELDAVKRMLTETNPILLVTTMIVSILHMLFEFLAFSSDVNHWRKKDKNGDLVGVSLRTIITNCVVQLIVLLYLQDSSEETSWMILFSQGMGLLIEAWKITKVIDIKVRPDPTSFIGYAVTFEDKHELSEDEKNTQEYDRLAFKIVMWGTLPFLLVHATYSLMYKTHRSWYSYIVTTLAQAVYMFGFAQLIPQLIINYKLKSVAHMPMRAMGYKFFSTIIDDLFAFCIAMPWLHRLACFRDDVVFVILLWQRWKYRIDPRRVNEYGQVGTDYQEKSVDQVEKSVDEKAESKKDK